MGTRSRLNGWHRGFLRGRERRQFFLLLSAGGFEHRRDMILVRYRVLTALLFMLWCAVGLEIIPLNYAGTAIG